MSKSNELGQEFKLSELMAAYLQRQTSAHEAGLGLSDAVAEVTPYEAVPVQPVDARLAWDEAISAIRCFEPQVRAETWQAPVDWSGLVASHEPATAVAFCAGNFPQLVRNIHPLLQASALSGLQPKSLPQLPAPGLVDWAGQAAEKREYAQLLLGIGALRLSRQFEQADKLLGQYRTEIPVSWQPAWANEEAGLVWHRGEAKEAAKLWLAQPASVPVLFNRGMAALFLGKGAEARTFLNGAVAELPDDHGWHHLGKLYLALAELRG